MEKSIKSRKKILAVAFKLFAKYSYPDVSYSLLEEATGISRGSMVYYFKNKEGIFRAVLDAFFYGPDALSNVMREESASLRRFLDICIKKIAENMALLLPYNIPNLSEARLNIARSANEFVEGFRQHAADEQESDLRIWEEVIGNSVKSGELRADIDVKEMAVLFEAITQGFFTMCSKKTPDDSIGKLRKMYDTQYALIKA